MRIIQESIPSDAEANNQSKTRSTKKTVQKNDAGSTDPPSRQGTETNEDKGKKKARGNDRSSSESDSRSENNRRTKDKGIMKLGRNYEDSSTHHDSDKEFEPPLVGKGK